MALLILIVVGLVRRRLALGMHMIFELQFDLFVKDVHNVAVNTFE